MDLAREAVHDIPVVRQLAMSSSSAKIEGT